MTAPREPPRRPLGTAGKPPTEWCLALHGGGRGGGALTTLRCVGNGAIVSLVVLGLVVVLFVTNRLPVEVVAIGSALVLRAAGVIDLDQAVAGFGDPTVILIAALFVVSEGLDATGVTTWVGRQLGARAGGSPRRCWR